MQCAQSWCQPQGEAGIVFLAFTINLTIRTIQLVQKWWFAIIKTWLSTVGVSMAERV
jgi:hypothetical protein